MEVGLGSMQDFWARYIQYHILILKARLKISRSYSHSWARIEVELKGYTDLDFDTQYDEAVGET